MEAHGPHFLSPQFSSIQDKARTHTEGLKTSSCLHQGICMLPARPPNLGTQQNRPRPCTLASPRASCMHAPDMGQLSGTRHSP